VDRVCTSNATQRVGLADGDELTARLVVLAGGTGGDLATRLGAVRCMVGPEHSMAFGFTIERRDGSPFGFDAVTYYPGGHTSRLAFLTLFRVGSAMRANLFAYWPNRGEPTRTFVREPVRELQRLMPGLTAVIGDVALVGRVESSRVDLYRTDRVPQEGIVLLADAFQSVCPTTGTGLSKVLTDVDVLCHDCVPQWLATPGMGADKIASYYRNPRKQDVDRRSLGGALYTKRMWTDPSLPWRLRRLRWWCENQVAGWRQSLKFTRKLTA
jgi:2-polyprenyl-6-methoxyphenol hydroxylase-like FAD-dependent oxidoreductase